MRWVVALFLLGHAAVHAVMWTLPLTDAAEDLPFDPAESWLLGRHPTVFAVWAGAVAVLFALGAVAVATQVSWWPPVLVVAGVASVALMLVTFAPWWLVGIALSVGIVAVAARAGG